MFKILNQTNKNFFFYCAKICLSDNYSGLFWSLTCMLNNINVREEHGHAQLSTAILFFNKKSSFIFIIWMSDDDNDNTKKLLTLMSGDSCRSSSYLKAQEGPDAIETGGNGGSNVYIVSISQWGKVKCTCTHTWECEQPQDFQQVAAVGKHIVLGSP